MDSTVEIFYSYAPKDEKLVYELDSQLILLKHQGKVATWGRRDGIAGDPLEDVVTDRLNRAQIILLFVSQYFMNSNLCQQVEVKRAMERYDAGGVRVIPIILRPVLWEGASFGKLKSLSLKGGLANRGAAFVQIAQELSNHVDALRAQNILDKVGNTFHPPAVSREQKNAVQQIIELLRELSQRLLKVNELKRVHHMLHELELVLDALTALLNTYRNKSLDYERIEISWGLIPPAVRKLEDFAKSEMYYLEEKDKPFTSGANQITGPEWAVKPSLACNNFAACLKDKALWDVLDDLARRFLLECQQLLFTIDGRLVRELNNSASVSEQILGSTSDGYPGV